MPFVFCLWLDKSRESNSKAGKMERADASEAMTHDEHDSSYNPMELQEESDSRVPPNVGFFPDQTLSKELPAKPVVEDNCQESKHFT